MARYSEANLKICGSHAGVSIGEDGFSQMGLEDLAMLRSVLDSVVVYPSDAVSSLALTKAIAEHQGLAYIRTSRPKTPVIYDAQEKFSIGGSKTLKTSENDKVTVIAAGVTLHEALKAYEELQKDGINIRVIDLYSIKPLDKEAIQKACQDTQALIVVEDHYAEGGMHEAVCASGVVTKPTHSLAVTKTPRSGAPAELLAYEEIDSAAITAKVKAVLG
jgi:transketolase